MKKITILMTLAMMMIMPSLVNALSSGDYMTDSASGDQRVNAFMGLEADRVSFLIPMILVFVCLVCFAIDFGAIGVATASVFALLACGLMGLLYINAWSIGAFTAIILLIIVKISDR